MQLVGQPSSDYLTFLKRDVNKALVGEKVNDLDMDLRSRVSTSLTGQTFARKRSGQPDYVSTTSMDQSLTSTRCRNWWTQTLFNVWPCIDKHSSINILARGHRVL